ncbi:MAG: discoidin domain-containing protein [Pirellulaceae bacterium]|nr:discoidin domain-containing protein [Planctomycetales bacterium]
MKRTTTRLAISGIAMLLACGPTVHAQIDTISVTRSKNIALGGTATATGPTWADWNPTQIIDGNIASIVHAAEPTTTFGYLIGLTENSAFEKINVFNRTNCCPERLTNYRVSILDDLGGAPGSAIWSADVRTDGTNSGQGGIDVLTANLDPTGTFGGAWLSIDKIEDPSQNDYYLQIAEVEVITGNVTEEIPINYALGALVTASGPTWDGWDPNLIVDGNLGTIVHASEQVTSFGYTIKLAQEVDIDTINIHNRTGCCPERLTNYRVSILDDNNGSPGSPIWSTDVRTDGTNSGDGGVDTVTRSLDPTGSTVGRWLSIDKIENVAELDYFLQIAEVEVWGRGLVVSLTVDRDTGAMVLHNESGKDLDIISYSIQSAAGSLSQAGWTPISGHYDAAGNGSVDPDDTWTIFSAAGSATDLSEGELAGGDGGRIADGATLNLGSAAWLRSIYEDVTMQILEANGSIRDVQIRFEGNSGNSYIRSDMNFDGAIDAADWTSLVTVLEADVTGKTRAEAYALGDLNGDGISGAADFLMFKADYEQANGAGSFQAMLNSVPEPAGAFLAMVSAVGLSFLLRRGRRMETIACVSFVACGIVAYPQAAHGQINVAPDGTATATGPTWSNWNPYRIIDGDLNTIVHAAEPTSTFGYTIQLANPVDIQAINVFNRVDGCCPERLTNYRVSVLSDNAGTAGSPIWSADVRTDGTNSGTAGVDMLTADLDPTGTFSGKWITIDKIDNAAETDYYLQIADVEVLAPLSSVPRLGLEVNRTTGTVRLINRFNSSFETNYYRIASAAGSLTTVNWNSLDQQNYDSLGNGIGASWDEAGASGEFVLAEAFLLGSSTFGPTDAANIGRVYSTSKDAQDLRFEYVDVATGTIMEGAVEYVTGGELLLGDYNQNGTVDAADYTIWKDNFGSTTALAADGNGNGRVDAADYTVWKDNFGSSLGTPSLASVPEPGLLPLLIGLAIGGFAFRSRNRATMVCAVACAAAWFVLVDNATDASAAVTIDRNFQMGDDSLENASAGIVVGSGAGNPTSGGTLDSEGPTGAYVDMVQTGGPVYVNAAARPGAQAGNLAIKFDGQDDVVAGIVLNRPSQITEFAPDFPLNYAGLTARGLQGWVFPEAAALGQRRQVIVMDSIAAGGPAITADGKWTQVNDGHVNDASIPAAVQVVGGQWYHVMHHVYPRNSPGAPNVVPGSGDANRGFTSVLYVNGMAVSANNGALGTAVTAGDRVGRLSVGAAEIGNDGTIPIYDDYFQGSVDDLKLYVFGDNSTGGGSDYGTFNLFTDNEWIAAQANAIPGGLKPGDINRDGQISQQDTDIFLSNWLRQKTLVGAHNTVTVGDWETWGWGDMNGDGRVYLQDAYILHDALVAATGSGLNFELLGQSTPEPSAATLLLIGLVWGALRRFR